MNTGRDTNLLAFAAGAERLELGVNAALHEV